ncbi:MAG: hypothetical protein U0V87_04355, partial [Acidobacteriota bacterium]
LNQFKEEHSTRLYDAVMNCARTKLVFGGLSAAQLEPMVRELAIGEFDPMAVKDEIRANEVIPIETTRTVVTRTTTVGRSRGRTDSEGTGDAVADSQTAGSSWGKIESTAEIETKGTASGSQSGLGSSQSISPDGTIVTSSDFAGSGESTVAVTSRGRMAGQSHQASESVQSGRTVTRSQSKQTSESQGDSESTGIATSLVPFHAYLLRERVTSRQFWTEAEFLTERLKVTKELQNSIYVLKAAGLPTLLVRSPYVRTPFVSERKRDEGLARIHGQSLYASSAAIQREEQERELRLLGDGAPHVTVLDAPLSKKPTKVRGRDSG